MGKPPLERHLDLVLCDVRPRLSYAQGNGNFSVEVIGHPASTGPIDSRNLAEYLLEGRAPHLLATAVDHVLLAVDYPNHALTVCVTHVSRKEPSAGEQVA